MVIDWPTDVAQRVKIAGDEVSERLSRRAEERYFAGASMSFIVFIATRSLLELGFGAAGYSVIIVNRQK